MNRVEIPIHLAANLGDNVHQPLRFPQSMPRSLNVLGSLSLTNSIPVILGLGGIELPPYDCAPIFLELHWSHLMCHDLPKRNFPLMASIPLLPISQKLTLLHHRGNFLQMLEIEIVSKILSLLIFVTRIISCSQAYTKIHHKSPIQEHSLT
ncbi:hypothetical protein TorRG33x02_061300 [Trema orientale]|uniref:Uncharacterized protein n=1 Tax=Trema orientale TaxID=63057 RepID=A0A2P5FJX4_TREOI|nr:hypothetical protein TorRG33x02_061300 [Trema orientale]